MVEKSENTVDQFCLKCDVTHVEDKVTLTFLFINYTMAIQLNYCHVKKGNYI